MPAKAKIFHYLTQVAIPVLTVLGQVLVAAKQPQWGLVVSMLAQPFWLYSSWKSYREVGQSGMFITTVLMALVTAAGIVNYWVKF